MSHHTYFQTRPQRGPGARSSFIRRYNILPLTTRPLRLCHLIPYAYFYDASNCHHFCYYSQISCKHEAKGTMGATIMTQWVENVVDAGLESIGKVIMSCDA